MAGETDPVRIVVEIIDQFSDDLAKLKAELDKIDRENINIDFDIDSENEIASVKAELQALRDIIDVVLDIDVVDEERAFAIKQALERDMRSTLHIDTDREGGAFGPDTARILRNIDGIPDDMDLPDIRRELGIDQPIHPVVDPEIKPIRDELVSQHLREMMLKMDEISFHEAFGDNRIEMDRFLENVIDPSVNEAAQSFQKKMQRKLSETRASVDVDFDFPKTARGRGFDELEVPVRIEAPEFGDFLAREKFDPEIFGGQHGMRNIIPDWWLEAANMHPLRFEALQFKRGMKQVVGPIGNVDDSFSSLGRTLLEYRPSIMDWWNVVGLLIPVVITLAGALIGLAAAIGAVAVASVALVGIGLLGWGNDTQEMMQNLGETAKETGRELFAAFKPLGDEFQPITERFLEGLAPQLSRLVPALKDFTDFEEPLAQMGSGLIDWLIEVLDAMHTLGAEASQVVLRMGGAFGDFLVEALSKMLIEVHKHQDAYIEVAELLLGIVVAIFNVTKAITFVISNFAWLIDIIVFLTSFLDNQFLVVLTTMVAAIFMAGIALEQLKALLLLNTSLLAGRASAALVAYTGTILSHVGAVWSWVFANNALWVSLARLIALTGAGAILVAGSWAVAEQLKPPKNTSGFGGTGRSGRGGTTNIVINGDVREREMDRLLDETRPVAREEISINERMSNG